MFHNLKGLSRAIKLSIQNNTILIIDMECHPIFGGNFNDYFIINCNKLKYCTNYKNLPIDLIDKYKINSAIHYGYGKKNRWANYKINLSNEVNILYGSSLQRLYKKIQVHRLFFKTIQSNNPIIKNKYLSVHFRNSDKKNCKRFK